MTVTKSEFLETVKKSQLLSPDQLQRWLDNEASDGVQTAMQMVREQVLTEWQAKYLLTGRYQLELGNYRLMDRIQRDELGDQFSALHKQLSRKVDIQVLSASIANDASRVKSFINRVSRTSILDHPHLSHVYDIDQVGGRYYLVTEHVGGKKLAELAPEELSTHDLARWLLQALNGLEHAHGNGTVHGDLSLRDIAIDPEQGVKILNLATTELRNSGNRNGKATPQEDLRALARCFGELLNKGARNLAQAGNDQLKTIIEQLSGSNAIRTVSDTKSQLKNWLAIHAAPGREEDLQIRWDEIEEPFETQSEAFISQTPSSQNRFGGKTVPAGPEYLGDEYPSQDEESDDAEFPRRWFATMALERPWQCLAAAFAIGSLISAPATYFVLRSFAPSPAAHVADSGTRSPGSTAFGSRQDNSSITGRQRSNEQVRARSAVNERAEEKALSQPESNLAQSGTETEPDSVDSLLPNQKSVIYETSESSGLETSKSQTGADTTLTSSEMESHDSQLVADLTEQSSEAVPKAQTITNSEALTIKPDPAAMQPATEISAEEFAKRSETPFGFLPKQLSLPDLDDLAEVKLGEVFLPNRFLLGAEIIAHPGISGAKIDFSAERDSLDNQRWLLGIGRVGNDRKTPIAALRKAENQLLFQWLPEAKRNKQAGYLKNCLLKLFTPDLSASFPLRAAVAIEPLMLTPEKLSVETQFDLDYLPAQENLVIELMPVNIQDTRLSPSLIDLTHGLPGKVLLKREDTHPLAWINVGLEVKTRVRLQVDFVVTDKTRVQTLKSLNQLQELANWSKQQELYATQQHQMISETPAQPGKGDEKRSHLAQLSRMKTEAKTAAIKFQDYVDQAPKMMHQPYGIRIAARFEGMEIELARTKIEQ
jgi:hypothetical protein